MNVYATPQMASGTSVLPRRAPTAPAHPAVPETSPGSTLGRASSLRLLPYAAPPPASFLGPLTHLLTQQLLPVLGLLLQEAGGPSAWAAAINQTSVSASRPLLTNVSLLFEALLRNAACCSCKPTSSE